MDTAQLLQAIKSRWDIPTENFLGVFPINHIPFSKCVGKFCFIYNTEPWPLEGLHWIAIGRFEEDGEVEMFDSMGRPPTRMIQSVWSPIVFNPDQIQSNCASTCGEYCVFFIYCRLKGIAYKSIVKCFDPDRRVNNDKIVSRFVTQMFDVPDRKRAYPILSRLCVQRSRAPQS